MAIRPIFIVTNKKKQLVKELDLEFKYYNGFSLSQKVKSIESLHQSAKNKNYSNILEVSTKADNKLGWQLSAFNLMLEFEGNKKISLECAFQGSKVFENNIQYEDLYLTDSLSAKKNIRLKTSGKLINFKFEDVLWDLEPKTSFYDWLYIRTLYLNYRDVINEIKDYKVFTDIEFNPKKSINCQARTCAILVSLINLDLLEFAISSKENFIKTVYQIEDKQLEMEF